jgi:hypothetical protein
MTLYYCKSQDPSGPLLTVKVNEKLKVVPLFLSRTDAESFGTVVGAKFLDDRMPAILEIELEELEMMAGGDWIERSELVQ